MLLWRPYLAAWAAACWCTLLPVALAHAQSAETGDRIEVSAEDSIETTRDTVRASGSVEIRRGATVFGADTVDLDHARRTLRAEGSVRLEDPRYRLRAAELEMNLDDETATIRDAEMFIEEGGIRLGGSRVEKFTGQTYEIRDGRFTTCLCEEGASPWRISAGRLRLEEGAKAVVDDATFYVYDVPVLYLPYLSFPYLTERTTGFLIPSFGWSRRDGFLYRQPFFWALDKSNDATFEFAVESRTRVGMSAQYRTVLDRNAAGRLELSYFSERMRGSTPAHDTGIADPAIPLDRWSARWTHRHRLPAGWATFSDIALYSDSVAPRELAEFFVSGAEEEDVLRSSRYSASRLGFRWHGTDMVLTGGVDYVQDLVQPQEHALHRVPHLSLTGGRGLGYGLDLEWDVGLTHYRREQGSDGLRVDVRPELTWRAAPVRHFRMDTRVALRETLYRLDSIEGGFTAVRHGDTGGLARNGSRELVELGWRLTTALSRTYDWSLGGWNRVRHVLEPAVEYLFIPATDQDELPIWDPVDRVRRRNLLTVALNNRFWGALGGKRGPAPDDGGSREADGGASPPAVAPFARASVTASLDVDKARAGEDGLADVGFGVRLDPVERLYASLEMGMEPGPWNLRRAALEVSLSDVAPVETRVSDRDFQRPSSVSLGYRFIRANVLSPLARHADLDLLADCPSDPRCMPRDALNGFHAGAVLRATDRMLLLYDGNYDGAAGRWAQNELGIKYLSECRCWTLTLSVEQRTNPDRTSVGFKFDFLGLGT